jgi:hypothetical protein
LSPKLPNPKSLRWRRQEDEDKKPERGGRLEGVQPIFLLIETLERRQAEHSTGPQAEAYERRRDIGHVMAGRGKSLGDLKPKRGSAPAERRITARRTDGLPVQLNSL